MAAAAAMARPVAGPSSASRFLRPASAALPTTTSKLPSALPRAQPTRSYVTSPFDQAKEQAKDRAAIGPFNLRAGALFLATGVGLFLYFRHERDQIAARKAAESANSKVGRPRIGGPFELTMAVPAGKGKAQGYRVTHDDIEGAFSLIYFGFTNCPDICPEELDKMGDVVDAIDSSYGQIINPIFISCDPARDSLPLVSTYISDFHPRLVGLTGAYEAVKQACKSYRVYFSTPPNADPKGDYLVDHSIFFYLMDPEGRFVDAFGRSAGKEEVEKKVRGYVEKWKAEGLPLGKADLKQRVSSDESRKVDA
ncbi:unnamed protein product [Jaminaea pallidilutea]